MKTISSPTGKECRGWAEGGIGGVLLGHLRRDPASGEIFLEITCQVPAEETQGRLGPTNTTLVAVATNARLSKERAHLLSLAAHEGISEAVRPAHTMGDGDTAFALATGEVDADQRGLEAMATAAVAEAIRRAVRAAESVPGAPAVRDLDPGA